MGVESPGSREIVERTAVRCPSCAAEAVRWTGEELYGIECPNCGHREAFHREPANEE